MSSNVDSIAEHEHEIPPPSSEKFCSLYSMKKVCFC